MYTFMLRQLNIDYITLKVQNEEPLSILPSALVDGVFRIVGSFLTVFKTHNNRVRASKDGY